MTTAATAKTYPIYLGGKFVSEGKRLEVRSPYNGEVVGITYKATPEMVEQAVQAAVTSYEKVMRHMPTYERTAILFKIADGLAKRRDEVARLIAQEAGKPIRDARVEVDRGVFTFRQAAQEAERIGGEVIPLDLMPASKGRMAIARRMPIGPVLGIAPFNFPLNLAVHKVAPAIAAGNSMVLKLASSDPLTMLVVAEIIAEAGLPAGALSVLPMDSSIANELVADDRFKLVTFTGSMSVGWALKARAAKKRVVLELGGNAGVIVDKGTDLNYAVQRITTGSFAYAGQTCISVQRVYVHDSLYDEFVSSFKDSVSKLKLGDPLDESTDVGPMIEADEAGRTEQWVQEAVSEGATLLTGGKRNGAFFEPTVIVGAKRESKVVCNEVFAPVVTVFPFSDFKEAVARVNDSLYGLQAGVFTPDISNAFYAFRELEVGGVIVNDIPSYRIDHMPYGGSKDSGMGREGLKYAIEDMTELRLMALNNVL